VLCKSNRAVQPDRGFQGFVVPRFSPYGRYERDHRGGVRSCINGVGRVAGGGLASSVVRPSCTIRRAIRVSGFDPKLSDVNGRFPESILSACNDAYG
jgi:hypothetical protein